MNNQQEPQTFWQAWDAFVEATGYWRFIMWLLECMTNGLNWLTRRLGSRTVRGLSRTLHIVAWLGLLVSFGLLAYGVVRGIVTGNGAEVVYFAGWIVIVTAMIVLFRKWWA